MTAPAKRAATYADIENLPPNVVGEIVDGELHVSPRPGPLHAFATAALLGELGGKGVRGGGPGGLFPWVLLVEPELHLHGQIVVPDIAGWRRSRMAAFPKSPFFEVAPDWICEVLSPSTALFDRRSKLPHYGRAGVEWAWLIDPVARSLEVYQCPAGAPPWVLVRSYGADDRARIEPFDFIELDLSELWHE